VGLAWERKWFCRGFLGRGGRRKASWRDTVEEQVTGSVEAAFILQWVVIRKDVMVDDGGTGFR
jgi:hypothetical protein